MSDDIERVPSMRKPARQGVPKVKSREMAKPIREGKTREAPQITPRPKPVAPGPHLERPLPDEPTLPNEPMLPAEPTLPDEPTPAEPTLALEVELVSEPLLEGLPPPVPIYQPPPEPEPEPEPVPGPEPAPRPGPIPAAEARPAPAAKLTLRQLVARVDDAFSQFRGAAARYPKERMDDHLGEDTWTRKQMLAHVAAWHDLTAERLIKMALTGKSVPLDRDVDKVNAIAARVAVGKTAGEVLKDVEATFARMRRQLVRMTDVQLNADDGWAIRIVAANTYEHYAEHIHELTPPEPLPGSGARR